jgi:hypothetical protein
MTKADWKAACARSINRLANLKLEAVGLGRAKSKP